MNKKGFTLVETIIAIVILASALILLYTSFTKLLQSEKKRVEYDDVAFIYRSYYIKNIIKKDALNTGIATLKSDDIRNVVKLDTTLVPSEFNADTVLLIKKSKLGIVKRTKEQVCDANNISQCSQMDEELYMYIRSLNVDVDCNYVFVAKYIVCSNIDSEQICKNYYSWVGVN